MKVGKIESIVVPSVVFQLVSYLIHAQSPQALVHQKW
jgi:hypothetical protein